MLKLNQLGLIIYKLYFLELIQVKSLLYLVLYLILYNYIINYNYL